MKKTSLKSNFFYNFICQIVVLLIPLITTPYLARVLGEEGNGRLSYSMSIVQYFILLANLGFNIYGQREISKFEDNIELRSKVLCEILIARFISTLVSSAIFLAIMFTFGFGDNYNVLIWLYGIQIFATVLDINFYYQGMEKFKSLAIRSLLLKLLGMIAIFVFVKKSTDLWIYALSISLSTVFANLIMWPQLVKNFKFVKLDTLEVKRHFLPSIMIFLPTLAVTVYSVFDKTMIGLLAKNPDYENGCYEQAYKLNSIILLFVTVLSPVFVARNSYDFNNGNQKQVVEHLQFSGNYVLFISLPLLVGTCLLAKNLSAWYLGNGYEEVPFLLSIMSTRYIFSGFGVLFGEQFFIVIGKEKYVTISTLCAAIINVTLNLILIPNFGASGAAIATATCEITTAFVLILFSLKYKKYINAFSFVKISWKYLVAALIMGVPVYFIDKSLPNNLLSFCISVFVGCLVYLIVLMILKDSMLHKIFIFVKNKIFYKEKKALK